LRHCRSELQVYANTSERYTMSFQIHGMGKGTRCCCLVVLPKSVVAPQGACHPLLTLSGIWLLWCICRGVLSTPTPLSLGHLTALTSLHTSGKQMWPCGAGMTPQLTPLFEQDVLPPNLVSLCVRSCEASLTPRLALKSLRKLSLASLSNLPLPSGAPPPVIICAVPVLPNFRNLSVTGQNSSVQRSQAGNGNPPQLALVHKRLPGVEIKVAKVCKNHGTWKTCCHCCSRCNKGC
jgi:hypothetical protein